MRYNYGNVLTRSDCGQKRCFYGLRITEVLRHNGMSNRSVARDLGISESAVSATINGRNHSPRILEFLRGVGVPEEYLFDPKNYPSPATAPVLQQRRDTPAADAV